MTKIANVEHKYYPTTWLDKKQAEKFLQENGINVSVTAKFCKSNRMNVSSTGHVWIESLKLFVNDHKNDKEILTY